MDLPVQILATYFTIYFLIPRYFIKKQFKKFALTFFFTLFLASFLNRALYYGLFNPLFGTSSTEGFFNLPKTLKMIFGLYPVVVLGSFIKIGHLWHQREQINQQLKNEQLKSEIKYLKAQIQPHFLFNTLNNLYALTLKNSEKAGEVVLKLSEMLNYFLYEGNQWQVSLDRELELLQNYIILEKIRYGERLEISFLSEGIIEGQKIAPLLLLPFVENSFKHGASQQQNSVWIKIRARVENSILYFHVSNNKKPRNKAEIKRKGLGLDNVEKRLDLLYKGHYSLNISEKEDIFTVDLVVSLDQAKTIHI